MLLRVSKLWLIPLAASILFLYILLEAIPYATGYGWAKVPLGYLTWQMWLIPDWEHAFFVPFICAFLLYMQRESILSAPIRGNNWGAGLIFFGILVYCLGLKAETQYIGFVAIEMLIAGLIIFFWGVRLLSIVSFVLIFSLFTWPMPFLDGMVALPLRLLMSHVSFETLNFLGMSCVQSGTAILSAPDPHTGAKMGQLFQIDIADPCSGLHSLFALMMISALAGYMAVKSLVARWLIFLASIPLAIIGNVFRILMLVWATEHLGSAFAVGTEADPSWFHMACGYVVYMVALVLLLGMIALVNSERFRSRSSSPTEPTGALTTP